MLKDVASLTADELDQRIAEALGVRPRDSHAEKARELVSALALWNSDEFLRLLREAIAAGTLESVAMWLACLAVRGYTRAAIVRNGEEAVCASPQAWADLTGEEIAADYLDMVERETQ